MTPARILMVACSMAALATTPGATAAADPSTANQEGQAREQSAATEDVREAAEVLEELRRQAPELAREIPHAKGVFIVPHYATGALLVGGSGGEGVLMAQHHGQWGEPGFYDIGNIDIGVQAGGAAGAIVMVLMNQKALEPFRHTDTDFTIGTQAGLTIVNWSARIPATGGKGDVVVWSDTKGLLAEASVGVGGIRWDEDEAEEYYNRQVQPADVLAGKAQNPHENVLRSEFAQFTTDAR